MGNSKITIQNIIKEMEVISCYKGTAQMKNHLLMTLE